MENVDTIQSCPMRKESSFQLFPSGNEKRENSEIDFFQKNLDLSQELLISEEYTNETCDVVSIKHSTGSITLHEEERHATKSYEVNVILPKNLVKKTLSQHSRELLLRWLKENSKNPYPTPQELIELALLTGCTEKQLRTFLVNYRMRLLKRAPRFGTHNQEMTPRV